MYRINKIVAELLLLCGIQWSTNTYDETGIVNGG